MPTLVRSLSVGLKEWDTVCDALRSGRQIILLRKGGIAEGPGGFQIEHRQFVLFPTFLHQDYRMLKPEAHPQYRPQLSEPDHLKIDTAAAITNIVQLANREQLANLDAEHIWTAPLIDMRFSYKPELPLYLLIVRAFRLPAPTTIANTPRYAGCKSWVPLDQQVDCTGARPVLDDAVYTQRCKHIEETIAAAPT